MTFIKQLQTKLHFKKSRILWINHWEKMHISLNNIGNNHEFCLTIAEKYYDSQKVGKKISYFIKQVQKLIVNFRKLLQNKITNVIERLQKKKKKVWSFWQLLAETEDRFLLELKQCSDGLIIIMSSFFSLLT